MNKYDRFMREIVDYLRGTWLDPQGRMCGSSEAEIAEVEDAIGKTLPAALKAWYRVAGKVPAELNDHLADFSLADLKRAQEAALELTQDASCDWEMDANTLPFSQRLGSVLFMNTSEGNPADPPVFLIMEGSQVRRVDEAFTVFMREMWLQWLYFPIWSQANIQENRACRERGDWTARKQVVDGLRAEVGEFRQRMVAQVYQDDVANDTLTGPRSFQERWLHEFTPSELYQRLRAEGLHIPFDWIDPPLV